MNVATVRSTPAGVEVSPGRHTTASCRFAEGLSVMTANCRASFGSVTNNRRRKEVDGTGDGVEGKKAGRSFSQLTKNEPGPTPADSRPAPRNQHRDLPAGKVAPSTIS